MRKYFKEANWTNFNEVQGVEEKWMSLHKIYNEGVKRYIPKMGKREITNKVWFNRKCEKAKDKKDVQQYGISGKEGKDQTCELNTNR